MSYFRKPFRPFQRHPNEHRANQRIRAREVLVISPDGHSLGVLATQDALQKAKQYGLDLVEISPTANPPVCKILDYGKFRYENSKRDKESKKHNLADKLKELKFRINIEDHDYWVKIRRAEHFLFKGIKVKIVLFFRGREIQRRQTGEELVQKIRQELTHVGIADAEPKLIGKCINMMLTPLPANKRILKYTHEDDVLEEEKEDHLEEENQENHDEHDHHEDSSS